MYNRYRRCCCQNNYNPQILENICNCAGTTAEYANTNFMPSAASSCGCCNSGYNCGCNSMDNQFDDCGCGFDEVIAPSPFPSNPMLAQSYVPIQEMDKTFTPRCGLKMGTIFPELVSPYTPCQSVEEIQYLKQANEIGEGCNKCC